MLAGGGHQKVAETLKKAMADPNAKCVCVVNIHLAYTVLHYINFKIHAV